MVAPGCLSAQDVCSTLLDIANSNVDRASYPLFEKVLIKKTKDSSRWHFWTPRPSYITQDRRSILCRSHIVRGTFSRLLLVQRPTNLAWRSGVPAFILTHLDDRGDVQHPYITRHRPRVSLMKEAFAGLELHRWLDVPLHFAIVDCKHKMRLHMGCLLSTLTR
jgi:hypothetical protein